MPEKISNKTQSIENNNALRQALVVIEHKIRNLEKRKTKLESYRAIQSSGKELSLDQKAAVAKYDEVAQSLEFARDLSKQMLQIANASEKEEKKKARKDAIVRAQAETAKIREVLTIQNILVAFSDETVRNDFLNGENGAVKLEENDFAALEKFCADIEIKRQESPTDQPFLVLAQRAAELFSLTIDGRPKQYGETTYEYVKQIFQKIQDSGYLDRAGQNEENFEEEEEEEEEDANNEQMEENVNDNEQSDSELAAERMSDNEIMQKHDSIQPCASSLEGAQPLNPQLSQIVQIVNDQPNNIPKFTSEAPSAAAVPAPAFPPTPQTAPVAAVVAPGVLPAALQQPQLAIQIQRQQGPHPIPIVQATQTVQQIANPTTPQIQGVPPPGHFPPTTVRAVEQAYFKQHQYIQQIRPLAEVIGGGNFFFLQDSELDSPEMVQGLQGPPHGFTAGQIVQHPQPQTQQTLLDGQQAVTNIPATSPSQPQQISGGAVVPQGVITQVATVQQNTQQQQQIGNKPSTNQISTSASNLSGQSSSNILTEKATATIPTQTFTNQSFPPIVPSPQVQSIYPQPSTNSSQVIHQQTPASIINASTTSEKPQQTPPIASNSQIQQTQSNQPPQPQMPQVFVQGPSAMPSITPHQLIAHHQQQQTLTASPQQNVAGTTNLNLTEQQAAALASLQQQHNQHPQLQQQTANPNNLSNLPTGFVNAKFPTNIVPTSPTVSVQPQQQQQQQTQNQISSHHSLNNQVSNINSIANGGAPNIAQPASQDKYDQTVRILEQKTQKLDIKERTNQVHVKDIISSASVNDWETDASKLQIQQKTTQGHKPSHYNTSHNATHFGTQHHNTSNNNNSTNERGSNVSETNQWSNDIHASTQQTGQNSQSNTGNGLNTKNTDWVSTFDSQESNHWNNTDSSGNYRNRQSFGRNERGNTGGSVPGVRNTGDRNDNNRSGGYRGRSNYSTTQNGNAAASGGGGGTGGISGGNRNSNVYFRNNDNYYQNGNSGGYNGGNKDNGNNRYGGGNGNTGENYRGRPTPGGANGPRGGGNGPPPRQTRNGLGNGGGMGPRGQTGGPRGSNGSYGNRPPRQQDVNVVN